MIKIQSGPANSVLDVANDGIAHTCTVGLFLADNSKALSASVLQVAASEGAHGLVIDLAGVAFAMPQMNRAHYAYVPPELRGLPVALIVNAEQAAFLQNVQGAAAQAGTLRKIFHSKEQAVHWLTEQTRARSANLVWWSQHRSQA
jgi:hypothetical protein